MADMAAREAPRWAMPYWAVVGALVGFGVAGILTIGAPFLLLGLALSALGMSRPQLRNRSMFGLLVGLVIVAAYVAAVTLGGSPPTGSGSGG